MRLRRVGLAAGSFLWTLILGMALGSTVSAQNTNAPSSSQALTQGAGTYDELKQLLKTRYDQKIVVAEVSGLFAGEQRKGDFGLGPGENGVIWSHFATNMQVPDRIGSAFVGGKKTSDLHQLDDHTFGNLRQGLNVSQIEKGEPLKVSKFYVEPEGIEFVLATTGLQHMRDLDYGKASKHTSTTVSGNQVNQNVSVGGFGMAFVFYFNKGLIKGDHDYQALVREIDKYLLPQSEAKDLETTRQNIEIEPGMTEDQVIQKLGQPVQAVKFGNQKTLKYNGMTVVLKDGKVVDVKVE
jgi:hypothetical protein